MWKSERPILLLAPMAGYTDRHFRRICREFGADVTFTEVITAEGIRRGHDRTLHYLEAGPDERPLVAHIYGSAPDAVGEAAAVIDALGRFDGIDLNAGCPVPKIASKGAGAALLNNLPLLGELVCAIRANTSLPVSVKSRIGPRPEYDKTEALVETVADAGASALYLHARYTSERHRGPAHWERLRAAVDMQALPVYGNGGIYTVADAPRMLESTGVAGLMVGRAALGRPWIFREIHAALQNRPIDPPTQEEMVRVIREHVMGVRDHMAAFKVRNPMPPERLNQLVCRRFMAHLVKYLSGRPGVKGHYDSLANQPHPEALMDAVESLMEATSRA